MVHIRLVAAANQMVLPLEGLVINHAQLTGQPQRADEAGRQAAGLIQLKGGMNFKAEMITQLCLIDFKIAAQEDRDIFIGCVGLVYHLSLIHIYL